MVLELFLKKISFAELKISPNAARKYDTHKMEVDSTLFHHLCASNCPLDTFRCQF